MILQTVQNQNSTTNLKTTLHPSFFFSNFQSQERKPYTKEKINIFLGKPLTCWSQDEIKIKFLFKNSKTYKILLFMIYCLFRWKIRGRGRGEVNKISNEKGNFQLHISGQRQDHQMFKRKKLPIEINGSQMSVTIPNSQARKQIETF